MGVPRGGTTWVARALSLCRSVRYVHEPDGVHEPYAFRARRLDGLVHYSILRPGDDAPNFTRLWEGVFSGGVKPRSLRDLVSRRAFPGVSSAAKTRVMNGGRRSLRLVLADGLAMPRSPDGGVETVLAKSVNSALAAEWIYDRFRPGVLVVRRDLRNVLASWITFGWPGPPPKVFAEIAREAKRRWDIDLGTPAVPFARAAAACAVMLLALHDDARTHPEWCVLQHEDACVDPVAQLRASAKALGLEWTPEAEAFVHDSDRPGSGYATQRVTSELPDGWRSRLSAEHLHTIDEMVASFPAELRGVAFCG